MATNFVLRYALDPTGVSPDNLIANEEHTLTTATNRPIATMYGAFFKESMVVTDLATGLPLASNQFRCLETYELPSARYGKEICAIVLITDPGVSNNVSLTYQCLGGEYSRSATAIVSQIEALQLDNRPVAWPDLLGIPDAFTPAKHLHDVGDVYGFEYLVNALDRIRAAIELGDAASHDSILVYIDHINQQLQQAQYQTDLKLDNHIGDTGNPHNVTAEQVGAYTTTQVDVLLAAYQTQFNAHVTNTNNPHQVTASQVGAFSKAEVNTLLNNLQTSLTNALQAHVSNTGNPHNTTAAQVGAYSIAEIDLILSDLTASMNDALVTHITDVNNPHQVTAAQVGAYSIVEVNSLIANHADVTLRNTWSLNQVFNKGFNLPVSLASSGTGWFIEGGMMGTTPALRIRYNATTVMTFALGTAISMNCGQLLNANDIAAFDPVTDTSAQFVMG